MRLSKKIFQHIIILGFYYLTDENMPAESFMFLKIVDTELPEIYKFKKISNCQLWNRLFLHQAIFKRLHVLGKFDILIKFNVPPVNVFMLTLI